MVYEWLPNTVLELLFYTIFFFNWLQFVHLKHFFLDPINVKSWEKTAELDKAQLIIIVIFVWQMYSLNSNCKTIKLWK